MSQRLPPLAPTEDLDFAVSFADLVTGGDTIVSASSTVTVTGATLGTTTKAPAWTNDALSIWLSGATAGVMIRVVVKIVTALARTFSRTYVIPFGEPVSLDQAKQQCRIELDETEEDELIAGYISTARAWAEKRTGHILVRRSFTDHFDCFGRAIEIQRYPVISVTEILYNDEDDAEQEYEDGVERLDRIPAQILPALNECFPTLSARGGVSVAYIAGHADGEAPPEAIQAMLLLIGHWYRNREAIVSGTIVTRVPLAAEDLCDSIRLIWGG